VGPRAGLDDMEKRKFLTSPGLELRLLNYQNLMKPEHLLSCSYFILPEPDESYIHTPILLPFPSNAFTLFSYLRLGLASGFFLSGFPAKILYAFSEVASLVNARWYKPEGRGSDYR
jgi:hypothetical protein